MWEILTPKYKVFLKIAIMGKYECPLPKVRLLYFENILGRGEIGFLFKWQVFQLGFVTLFISMDLSL